MTWVLVIYIYAGMWAKGDNVTLTTVSGFTSLASCEAAGKQSRIQEKRHGLCALR